MVAYTEAEVIDVPCPLINPVLNPYSTLLNHPTQPLTQPLTQGPDGLFLINRGSMHRTVISITTV